MSQDIFELKMHGYCCSQIIMELGLRKLEKNNPDLISAMAGLCGGIWHGMNCGILSGAMCLMYLANPHETNQTHAHDLSVWFEDAFGSVNCDELLADNPLLNKVEKCPMMLEATFTKVCELLEWD